MSLTRTDLKAIGQVIDKIVSPRFDKLEGEIDLLAKSTADGFNRMYERFKQVDRRFDQVDERFDSIEKRLKVVENDTSRLRGNFMGIRRKIADRNP